MILLEKSWLEESLIVEIKFNYFLNGKLEPLAFLLWGYNLQR